MNFLFFKKKNLRRRTTFIVTWNTERTSTYKKRKKSEVRSFSKIDPRVPRSKLPNPWSSTRLQLYEDLASSVEIMGWILIVRQQLVKFVPSAIRFHSPNRGDIPLTSVLFNCSGNHDDPHHLVRLPDCRDIRVCCKFFSTWKCKLLVKWIAKWFKCYANNLMILNPTD